MDLAMHVPDGWLGTMENGISIGFRKGITQVQQNFRNTTMHTRDSPGYTCEGTCHGAVQGAGLSHRRSATTKYLEMNSTATNDFTVFAINATMLVNGAPLPVPFYGNGSFNTNDMPSLRLLVLHVSSVMNRCISTITIDTYDFSAAVVEYPVTVQNSTISLRLEELTSMHEVSTSSTPNGLSTTPNGTAAGLLGSLRTMIDGNYATNTTKLFKTSSNTTVYGGDGSALPDKFLLPESPNFADCSPTHKCAVTWGSPTEYVLRERHTFVLRSALRRKGLSSSPSSRRARGISAHRWPPWSPAPAPRRR